MKDMQEAYENFPYPHYVHPLADVAHLAAVAGVLGAQPVDPQAAHVLELGCGSGSDLLAMAARLPGSRFLGLDFSAPDIASARALAEEAGLTNVEFRQEDLLTWQPAGNLFDYIIVYGVFSWVKDELQNRLLELCRKCLAPQGIACVCYLTYPGSSQAGCLRDLLRLRADAHPGVPGKLAAAHEVLDFLDLAYTSIPEAPHAVYLKEEVRRIREKEPFFLLHDELGLHRDPCYFLQFTDMAAGHGLSYLGESELPGTLLENLPPAPASALAGLKMDRLETEQWMDYIVNRAFRCSLLTGPEAILTPGLAATAQRRLCFRPFFPTCHDLPVLDSGQGHPRSGGDIPAESGALDSFVSALSRHPRAFTAYGDLLREAEDLAGRQFATFEEAALIEDLLTLYGGGRLGLSMVPFAPSARWPALLRLTPVARAFSRCRGMIVTPFQEGLPLTPPEQALCARLDGTLSLPELYASPEGTALDGILESFLEALSRAGAFDSED